MHWLIANVVRRSGGTPRTRTPTLLPVQLGIAAALFTLVSCAQETTTPATLSGTFVLRVIQEQPGERAPVPVAHLVGPRNRMVGMTIESMNFPGEC